MKFAFAVALLSIASAVNLQRSNQDKLYLAVVDDCPEVMEMTDGEIQYQLG